MKIPPFDHFFFFRKIPHPHHLLHEITSSSPFLFFRKIPPFHDAACHLLHLHHGELLDHQHYPSNVTHIMIFMFSLYHHSVHESLSFEYYSHHYSIANFTNLNPLLRWGCWTSTSDRRRRTRCRRGWRTCSRWSCPGSCSWRDLFTPQSKYKYTTHPLPAFDQKLDSFWGQTWTPHRQQSYNATRGLKFSFLSKTKHEKATSAGTAPSLRIFQSRSQMRPQISWTITPRPRSEYKCFFFQ